ncbi:MAG TPA: cyclopropane-fatty-acyl-phospholipid synthase family protein [Acidimicrobiales bacterium]
MGIAELIHRALDGVAISIEAYDGSAEAVPGSVATLQVRSPDALRRFVTAPNDLGLGRAYVAGDLDVEGDLFGALAAIAKADLRPDRALLVDLARAVGVEGLRPLPPPPEEARMRGARHSRERDAAAISYHYDLSNDFYRLMLGPAMTYSCAVWEDPSVGLQAAQAAKHELVCEKLGLRSGMRLLDVGCGWGSMALHAAEHHGVEVVGVTVSPRQVELGVDRVKEAGLTGQVDIRLQDYRDVDDGPFDAISSIGMFEHVGRKRLADYFGRLHSLLSPEGRLLNHGICRTAQPRDARTVTVPEAPWHRRTFINHFVFPDGELHELGSVISAIHQQGFEVRHVEGLREHYALTLRAWVANLEANWDDAVRLAGFGRARVWRLYTAACAVGFEDGRIQIHQALAAKAEDGHSGFPLRPAY